MNFLKKTKNNLGHQYLVRKGNPLYRFDSNHDPPSESPYLVGKVLNHAFKSEHYYNENI